MRREKGAPFNERISLLCETKYLLNIKEGTEAGCGKAE